MKTGAGVALGVIGVGARQVTDEMMLAASKALSGCVTTEELKDESILPRIERLRWVLSCACVPLADVSSSLL